MPQPLVIYHGDCSDGFTAAWAFRKLNPSVDVEYVPAKYHQPPPDVSDRDVYVLDFSYPRDVLLDMKRKAESLLVLDHHKTAEADLAGLTFCVFDMERSGCGITWDYFTKSERPWLVNIMEDRDLWRFRYEDTLPIVAYAACLPMTFEAWDQLVESQPRAIEAGTTIRLYIDKYGENASKDAVFREIGGYRVPIINISYQNCSDHLHRLCQHHPEAPFAASFFLRGDEQWQFSLRSIGDFDVSEIAKEYGGGGHKHAAGFDLGDLPWRRR